MKFLVVPDKFKDSLTAQEVCDAIELGISKVLENSQIVKIPLADGGEGSLSILEKTLQFEKIKLPVHDPIKRKIEAYYGLKNDTAFIEMAQASGLQLLEDSDRNVMQTTSLGTGELILDAINNGVTNIYLFVGGSATNDFGIGIASALGWKFLDKNNKELDPIGKNLINISKIKKANSIDLTKIKFKVLTDVSNPLLGNSGAAKVYAKQKGANEKEIEILDQGLRNISEIVKETFGVDVSQISGTGAAGGIGGGMKAFFNAEINSGIETIINLLEIDKEIINSDLVITGEGKFDEQSLEGKVIKGIYDLCKKQNKKLGIICGISTLDESKLDLENVIVKSIKTEEISLEDSMKNAFAYVSDQSKKLLEDFLVKQ